MKDKFVQIAVEAVSCPANPGLEGAERATRDDVTYAKLGIVEGMIRDHPVVLQNDAGWQQR